jgi:hypothetical protein
LVLEAQGLIEDWREAVNPFASLSLTDLKEEGLDDLEWVELEVKQDEQQAISIRAQQRLASATLLPLARLLAALLGLMLDMGGRKIKCRQEIEKRLQRDPSAFGIQLAWWQSVRTSPSRSSAISGTGAPSYHSCFISD